MIRKFILGGTLITGAFITADSLFHYGYSNASGAPAGRCGSPADGGLTCTSCHSGAAVTILPGLITSTIPPSGYISGTTYTVTASISRPGHLKFGFEVSPQKSNGTKLGTLVNTSAQTQLVGSGKYITHTSSGVSGTGSKSWSFNWIAPAIGSGSVTFYGAVNAANGNNQSGGDSIFTSTLLINEDAANGITDIYVTNSMNVFPNPVDGMAAISYFVPASQHVEIKIMDAYGNICQNIVNENQTAGENRVLFDASALSSGLYFVWIKTRSAGMIRKIIVQ